MQLQKGQRVNRIFLPLWQLKDHSQVPTWSRARSKLIKAIWFLLRCSFLTLTPDRTHFICELKISSWNYNFLFKNDSEKWSTIFYLVIIWALFSLARPIQPFWQIFLKLDCSFLFDFKIKILDHFSPSFLSQNAIFKS